MRQMWQLTTSFDGSCSRFPKVGCDHARVWYKLKIPILVRPGYRRACMLAIRPAKDFCQEEVLEYAGFSAEI